MEDSRNALFVEPGAYIQRVNSENANPKKIIFQEPYESMPSYHMNSGLKKSECSCDQNVNQKQEKAQTPSFDIKSLSPILNMFGGSSGLGGITNLLSSFGGEGGGIQNLISTVMSNPDLLKNVMSLFNRNKNSKKNPMKQEFKKSDFEIKNYTKVE